MASGSPPMASINLSATPWRILGGLGLEQQAIGAFAEGCNGSHVLGAADVADLEDSDAGFLADGLDAMRCFRPMQLDPVWPERRHLRHQRIVGIDEHDAGFGAAARQRDQLADGIELEMPGRALKMHEADHVGPGSDGSF